MIGLILILALLFLLVAFSRSRRRSLPPGPPRLPLLGTLPWIKFNSNRGIIDFCLHPDFTKYKVSTITLGTKDFFWINDYNLAKELFSKDEFSGRKVDKFALSHRFFNNEPQGIIATKGDHWKSQRRFSLKILKDFGFGRRSLESLMYIEVENLRDKFQSNFGDMLIGNDFNLPIINVLWQLVAGQRFSDEDPTAKRLINMVTELLSGEIIILGSFPHAITRLFSFYHDQVRIFSSHRQFMIDTIERHKNNLNKNDPQDFIDVYLLEMMKDNSLSMEDLVAILLDFFQAGTETSSTTLKWAILYLTLNQEVQTRCRSELTLSLSGSRPSVSDLPRLPYLQATIAEIQRLSRVAPASIPHRTTKQTTINGFTIPQDSLVLANLSYFMHDPTYFSNPQEFRPERFLQDGKFYKEERMVPFGIGKRICMGETLARNEIFLFLSVLLQDVVFLPPSHHPPPDPSKYCINFTSIPEDFFIRIKPTSNLQCYVTQHL